MRHSSEARSAQPQCCDTEFPPAISHSLACTPQFHRAQGASAHTYPHFLSLIQRSSRLCVPKPHKPLSCSLRVPRAEQLRQGPGGARKDRKRDMTGRKREINKSPKNLGGSVEAFSASFLLNTPLRCGPARLSLLFSLRRRPALPAAPWGGDSGGRAAALPSAPPGPAQAAPAAPSRRREDNPPRRAAARRAGAAGESDGPGSERGGRGAVLPPQPGRGARGGLSAPAAARSQREGRQHGVALREPCPPYLPRLGRAAPHSLPPPGPPHCPLSPARPPPAPRCLCSAACCGAWRGDPRCAPALQVGGRRDGGPWTGRCLRAAASRGPASRVTAARHWRLGSSGTAG